MYPNIVISNFSEIYVSKDSSAIVQEFSPISCEKDWYMRLVKVILSGATSQTLAVICENVQSSVINSKPVQSLGVFHCIGKKPLEYTYNFPWVKIVTPVLSSVSLSLWNIEKNLPVIPHRDSHIKVTYVIEITSRSQL